ncbi:MAG: phosphonate C-P lyase system protein PhnG [Pseudomonadota bacterium]
MDRKSWMSTLAKADPKDLASLWADLALAPSFTWLRRPESGAVMVRGRAGGTGAAFNLGEMTVTRCTLQIDEGAVGFGYVQGRDKRHAELAALADALLQSGQAKRVHHAIIAPLQARAKARQAARASKAAATKVDFFTMARGED